MKRILAAGVLLMSAGFAWSQITAPTTDVLGAHLNYGRGCAACHAPHSGSSGNGSSRRVGFAEQSSMLWGEDASGLFGKTITTDGGRFVEVLPASVSAGTPDAQGLLTCLSCHDGNYAQAAMMKNRMYEALPSTYGTQNNIPTLINAAGTAGGSYLSEHPVGLSSRINCGGSGWDCVLSNGVVSMRGTNSSRFVSNYGFFVKPGVYNGTAVVVCTTCHEPHLMNVVTINSTTASGMPAGRYATMFFLRAPYNPKDTNPMSNQTSQFCRQCHADKSNEMNGSSAGTVF